MSQQHYRRDTLGQSDRKSSKPRIHTVLVNKKNLNGSKRYGADCKIYLNDSFIPELLTLTTLFLTLVTLTPLFLTLVTLTPLFLTLVTLSTLFDVRPKTNGLKGTRFGIG